MSNHSKALPTVAAAMPRTTDFFDFAGVVPALPAVGG
jgi:hypothetical protein